MPYRPQCALLLFLLVLAAPVSAQVCTGDVTLSSQAEVDAFDCSEITGSLAIDGGDIVDLTPLAELTSVGGYITIYGNLALISLAGLEGLTSVGGGLDIRYNDALPSLAGLGGLTGSVGGYLTIRSNTALTSLAGLEGISSIGGYLFVKDNDALPSLAALEGLTSLRGLFIDNNDALTSLAALEGLSSVGDRLSISDNVALTSLTGLEGLTSVGGSLNIYGNVALTSLAGLEGLTSVGEFLQVVHNAALSDCACGLRSLISGDPPGFTGVTGRVNIFDNAPDGECTSPPVVLEASTSCSPVANEPSAGVPGRFALGAAYPNPLVTSRATLEVDVPEASDVRVAVYDALGRTVAVLLSGPVAAGTHAVALDAGAWASGTYVIRMTAGSFAATQRLTVVR